MMTSRRRFLFATTAFFAVPRAHAQPTLRRMAWFGAGRAGTPSPFLDAMRAGLRELGWEEGRNLALTPFWTDGTPEEAERLARQMVAVAYVPIQAASGLDGALRAVAEQKCDALVAFPDAVMLAHSGRIARFAQEARIATASGWGGFADNGFLLTLGPNLHESYRGLARYVDRVLRGTRPDELPVEFPRTVELVLNLRTARTLGVTIPQSILLRASRVIE